MNNPMSTIKDFWQKNQWKVAFLAICCGFVALTFFFTTKNAPISSGFPEVKSDCTIVSDTGKTDTAKQ